MNVIDGLQIIFDPNALGATEERLFPASCHRSKRIPKQSIIRFGGEYRMLPCMWRHRHTIFACPSLRTQLEVATRGQL
jgi:hypothetical protein